MPLDSTNAPPGRTSGFNATDAITSQALTLSQLTRPTDPARMTLENAKELIGLPSGFEGELRTNRRLYYGDHWLDGDGYKGPWPTPPDGATPAEAQGIYDLQEEIVRGFTSVNTIAECLERHTTGVAGTEPRWTWTPDGIKVRTPRALRRPTLIPEPPARVADGDGTAPPTPTPTAEDAATTAARARVEQLNSLLTTWWDTQNCGAVFQEFVRSLLYGRVASLRLYIPPSAMEPEMTGEGTDRKATGRLLVRVKDAADALRKIHVEVVDPDGGRVVKERTTLADIGVRLAKRGENTIAHATYLDANGRTVVAVVDQTSGRSDGAAPVPVSFDLGGRLLMFSAVREAFVTEQVRQSQYALNHANSMIPRNVTTGGFLETIVTNAHVPGHWETKDGQRHYIPDPIVRGPAALNVWQGHELEDAQGAKSMTTPGVFHRPPVDPTAAIKAKREHRQDILGECDQLHVLIAGDAVASGISRIQARADHIAAMGLTKAPVERAGRWLLETVTAFAHALTNAGGSGAESVKGLRVSFNCFLDAGPLDAAERAQNTADVGAGTLSVETAIERNSVSDVDAELERIDAARVVDLETKRAAIFGAWIQAGADEAFAAWRAGLSESEVARLVEAFTPPPDPVAPGTGGGDGGAGGGDGGGDGGSE